ncbi:SdiA-regulated domain-containing protein [Aquimarina brevivitae]|uniref:SdiA-regulated protein n=1 Tax=Aquimarina brevivitae TaxID=323412 RepID=A0A4Q7NTZ9_9FLAO|nr:SdiA-regulated domain-containing protein [Aquimarina brevivitae]RZS90514.1 SdiA-regulated protein [Aquimarina brevivitae]
MFKTLYFYSLALLLSISVQCQSTVDTPLQKINILSKLLKEASGITYNPEASALYVINDSGNDAEIFQLDLKGNIIQVIDLPSIENVDWEDLTYDNNGNIYIGDFGNNDNDRRDLAIYKIKLINTKAQILSKISFALEDQKAFPPKKKNRNFDIEAFVYHNHHFYLFSKNRSSNFNGTSKVYELRDDKPQQKAKLIATLDICKDEKDCFVTSAALNHKGNQLVLLTYNKIFVADQFSADFSALQLKKIKLEHYSQKEGICFINDSTLYIVAEGRGNSQASIYEFKLTD